MLFGLWCASFGSISYILYLYRFMYVFATVRFLDLVGYILSVLNSLPVEVSRNHLSFPFGCTQGWLLPEVTRSSVGSVWPHYLRHWHGSDNLLASPFDSALTVGLVWGINPLTPTLMAWHPSLDYSGSSPRQDRLIHYRRLIIEFIDIQVPYLLVV